MASADLINQDKEIFLEENLVEPLANPPVADPYTEFLRRQRKREVIWSAQRAEKKAKQTSTSVGNNQVQEKAPQLVEDRRTTLPVKNLQRGEPENSDPAEVDELKRQLEPEKCGAFELLASQVEKLFLCV